MSAETAAAEAAAPAGAGSRVARDATPDALASALTSERSLLEELSDTLERQRDAIADDDLDTVESTVHGVHRLLVTLEEARRGRRTLIGMLTGDASTPLHDLDGALGPAGMTEALGRARSDLVSAAEDVSEELELNRRVLETALAANDELVRTLFGSGDGEGDCTYERDADGSSPGTSGGMIIDQHA